MQGSYLVVFSTRIWAIKPRLPKMIMHVENVLESTIIQNIKSIMTITLTNTIPRVNDTRSTCAKVIPKTRWLGANHTTVIGADPIATMGVDLVEVDITLDLWQHEVAHGIKDDSTS